MEDDPGVDWGLAANECAPSGVRFDSSSFRWVPDSAPGTHSRNDVIPAPPLPSLRSLGGSAASFRVCDVVSSVHVGARVLGPWVGMQTAKQAGCKPVTKTHWGFESLPAHRIVHDTESSG